jgi:hypothetical protein
MIRELEQMKAEASEGSQRRSEIEPILQAKKERRQNARTWTFFMFGTAVALLGIADKLMH